MDRRIGFPTLSLLALMLSGCFGGIVSYPIECVSDYPLQYYVYTKDSWGPFIVDNPQDRNPSGNPLTKGDFLRDFGKPDEIVSLSADKEMWVYNRSEFCGVIPIYIVPVPLVLPVCNEFDHVTFENDTAVHIHFRRVNGVGFMSPGFIGKSNKCPADYISSISPEMISIPGTEECRHVGFRDGIVWWTDDYDIITIEPHTREIIARIPIVDRNGHAVDLSVTGFGAVWAGSDDPKHHSLSRIDLETGKILANIPLDYSPEFIATGEGAVWAWAGGYSVKHKTVFRIDPQSNKVAATILLEQKKGPNDSRGPIAIGEDAVWILHDKLSFLKGALLLLSRVDPQTNQVTATIPIGNGFGAWNSKIAFGSGSVWVAIYNKVFRIDPQTNQVEDIFKEGLDTGYWLIDMSVTDDRLWILGLKDTTIGLEVYDTKTNTLRSIADLGSSKMGEGSHELQLSKITLAAADDAVWVCLPLGLYVIPMAERTNQPGVP
jgi:hypothetical protein